MLRLYIFDMGGVLSSNTNVAPLIAKHLNLNPARFDELVKEDIHQLAIGAISVPTFSERFSRRVGREIEHDLYSRFFHPETNPKVMDLILRLKRVARVVVGTNTIGPHYNLHVEKGDYEIFDAIYASNRIGFAKPDEAFYSHILQAEGCNPEESVFIDDMDTNVAAARKLGMHSFVFENVGKLERELDLLKQRLKSR